MIFGNEKRWTPGTEMYEKQKDRSRCIAEPYAASNDQIATTTPAPHPYNLMMLKKM